MKSKKKFYTNGIITIKLADGDEIPEGFYLGRTFKSNPWNKGLTAETDIRVKNNTTACHKTRHEKNNYISWNTGLTKETNDSLKRVSEKLSAYRLTNPMSEDTIEKMNEHIIATKRKNNSFNKSKPEEEYYKYLLTQYEASDIIRQYSDERYPFNCDFYIKSKDLFIELNYSWCHMDHLFDEKSDTDRELLSIKQEKAKESTYHAWAIKIWTESDPVKLKTFRDNNLNFMIIYRNGLIICN